jgi:hypothetical protein
VADVPGSNKQSRVIVITLAIIVVATLLRLRGIAFGLPALLDPDEPIFIMTGLKLIRGQTLNPGWFGHPGTTTIYALAVIELATFGAWTASGRFESAKAFGQAIYTDPGIIFLPGRIFILICGLATIVLTMVIARRLFGSRVALIAGLLLAIDPVHIRYSQIIRTDMHATVFVLLEVLAALVIVERGRTRDYLLAAVWLGFAVATKWPAGTCIAAVVGATLLRLGERRDTVPKATRNMLVFGAASIAALFVASPYLFLDTATVLDNIRGEERPFHLGATGHGFLGNVGWYAAGPFATALGTVGLVFAIAGLWIGYRRSRAFAAVVVPVFAAFLLMISVQALVWERWAVPLLPLLTIAAAVGLVGAGEWARARFGTTAQRSAIVAGLAAVAIPLLLTGRAQARERDTDTRLLAGAWAKRHIPPGSTVVVEHAAFDILGQPWRFLYPMGSVGCVDVRAALGGKIAYSTVDKRRGGKPVVDIGSVDPARFASCRGDWAITANWDRYLVEPAHFRGEIANYARLARGGRIVATFRPEPGRIGGPIVRVVRLAPPR